MHIRTTSWWGRQINSLLNKKFVNLERYVLSYEWEKHLVIFFKLFTSSGQLIYTSVRKIWPARYIVPYIDLQNRRALHNESVGVVISFWTVFLKINRSNIVQLCALFPYLSAFCSNIPICRVSCIYYSSSCVSTLNRLLQLYEVELLFYVSNSWKEFHL